MKKNGKNVITDNDVTVTAGTAIGENLSDILDSYKAKLDQLEGNIKWIYKNGGVGTGSGGGSGSSTTWKIVVTRVDTGDILVSNSTVNLSGIGNYTFSVQIYGGGQSTFKVTSSFLNSKGQQSSSNIITQSDGFLWQKGMYLDLNGNISITVVNQDTQEVSTFVIPYIVTSHTFYLHYVYKDSKMDYSPSNNTIFMEDVKDKGLQAALTYSVAVGLTTSEYSYTDWDGNTWKISQDNGITKTNSSGGTEVIVNPGEVPSDRLLLEKSSNTIYIDLCSDIMEFLSDNSNAKYTQFFLDINMILEGNTTAENIDQMSLKDNLIPSGMYLKLTTSGGTLYEERQTTTTGELNYPTTGQFSLGSMVYNLTPYFGSLDSTRKYVLEVGLGTSPTDLEDLDLNITQLSDQSTQSVAVPVVTSGEHYIKFTITAENTSYSVGYYFFVKESTSSFDWFPKSITPTSSSYYRRYVESSGINLTANTALSMSANNVGNKSYTLTQPVASTYNTQDQLLCIGIQYSSINETEYPILSFKTGDTYKRNIFIYQDKIKISLMDDITTDDTTGLVTSVSGDECEIFIPMATDFDDNIRTNYHQLCIYKKFEKRELANYYKGIYIYLDGVLEAAFNSFETQHSNYTGVTFYPGNYYINEIEYHCFDHTDTSTSTTWLTDNDFIGYYYTFYEKLLDGAVDENEITLYDAFSSFECDEDNFVKTNATAIQNIAKASKVPVLVMSYIDINGRINDTYSGYNRDNLKNWLSAEYGENDEIEDIGVTIQWADGKGTELNTITKEGVSSAANFSMTLQGSSTMGYRCKNFELKAPGANETGKTCIYTPNFNQNDTSTFLPEESFTLKADVVDSSHTNNNAMGTFINDITTPFALAKQNKAKYGSYIKNCLVGFPVLVFLHTRYKEDINAADANIENYYFLGIYNFNLGRKSYFNLGYKDLSALENIGLSSGFHIYEITDEENAILSSVVGAEIQGNNKFFDFSQYNESILYETGDGDETYMFGDFVDGVSGSSGKYANAKSKISSFVKRVAMAGGYAFTTVGKNFSNTVDDNYGYDDKYSAVDSTGTPKNQVPNYLYQATRTKSGTSNVYTYSKLADPASENDLKNLLIQDESGESTVSVGLDYAALCEYYTVCMAFGLVDSVQKNLNIKSWNSGTSFYPAFYDMDTCLGVSNSGSKISYFAFSDYWESGLDSSGKLKQAKVWRDYSPRENSDASGEDSSEESSSSFFDVPSSYLFAIAKYAYPILKSNDLVMHPSNLWGLWRNSSRNEAWVTQNDKQKGCLSNASYFMETYYNNHLKSVPLSAFNYNYKYKYFVLPDGSYSFDNTNFPKFYGRKQAYTANWLNGRLHILDAYFNLNRLGDAMTPDGFTPKINAPIPDTDYVDTGNSDIYVLKDIFSTSANGNQYANLSAEIQVTARPYAPLIQKGTNSSYRYIFPESGDTCGLSLVTDGNQYSLLGGSSLWTYLSSINPFITSTGTLMVNSDYFTKLTGTTGTCKTWNINTPSLKEISLTNNANYSGKLSFSSSGTQDEFPNLKKIDISGTNINLVVQNESPTTLTATNMKPESSIDISNVSTLTSVSIGGSLTSLNIPAWKQGITLPTVGSTWACGSITISNNTKTYPNNTLTVQNNTSLTTLTISGFTSLTISNCPKLNTLNINDKGVIKTINIVGPDSSSNTATTFKVGTEDGVVDLSEQTALTTLTLKKMLMTTIKLPNKNIDFPSQAFYNCYNLKYIVGSGNYFITSTQTFFGCRSWTYRQEADAEATEENPDPTPNFAHVYVKSTCTSLYEEFYITGVNSTGSLDYKAAKYFLDECTTSTTNSNISAKNVTNLDRFLRNHNIEYTLEKGWEEYLNGECSLSLKNFPKANSVHSLLWDNPIDFFNKYMFQGLGSSSTTVNYYYGCPMLGLRKERHTAITADDRTYKIEKTTSDGANTYNILYCTIDSLEYLSAKMNGCRFRARNSDNQYLYFIEQTSNDDTTPVGLSTVSIHDFLWGGTENPHAPVKLTRIEGFEIFPDQQLDFTEAFTSDCTTISNTSSGTSGLYLDEFFARATYRNIEGLSELFYNINVNYLGYAFGSITLDNTDEGYLSGRIDISRFFNFGVDTDLTNSTAVSLLKTNLSRLSAIGNGDTNYSHLNFPKYTSYSDFQRMCSCLIKYATNCTRLERLFYNCCITGSTPDEFTMLEEGFEDAVNTKIVNTDAMFDSMRFRSGVSTSDNKYLTITHDFLKCLPNLKLVKNMFYNTLWANTIPFDFFNKRVESKSTVYVADGTSRKAVDLITYTYNRHITSFENVFYGVRLYSAKAFDPEASYNKGSFKKSRLVSYDASGNEVDEGTVYYDNATTTKKNTVKQNTEITDTENIDSDYIQRITSLEVNGGTKNFTNFGNIDPSGCFIAPDILYGASTSECTITGAFYNSNGSNPCFTGVFPDNLLKNCKSSLPTNCFYNLGITPKFFKSYYTTETDTNGDKFQMIHKFYYYVPVDFTSATSLANVFNFKLIAPPIYSAEKHYYMLFLNGGATDGNSLPTTVSSLSGSTPVDSLQDGFIGAGAGYPRFYLGDYGIRYSLMGTPVYSNIIETDPDTGVSVDTGEKEFSGMDWGLDLSTYSGLKLDNIVYPMLAAIMYGNAIKEGTYTTWNKNTMLANTSNYFIRFGYMDYSGLSYNFRVNIPLTSNSMYITTSSSYYDGSVINTDSIINYSAENYDTYKGYYSSIQFWPDPTATS